MTVTFSCRSALAIFLSFSVSSLTCVAQPLAGAGGQRVAKRFAEERPAPPEYREARSLQQNRATTAARNAGQASLNFPPDRNDAVALQCDQLADNPLDSLRIGDGVLFQNLQVEQALPVCEQAAEAQPPRPRYQYLYGRVLDAGKRHADAAAQYAAGDQGGYGFASYNLGLLYNNGEGVQKDLEMALRCYFRAGNSGIADAFAEGAEIYLDENPPNYVEANSWLEHAVEGGSALGFDDLGWLYEMGYGVNKDVVKAVGLFNEASKRGNAEGAYRVGVAYFYGLGVTKDRANACLWFLQAANQGYPYAESESGYCYYNGTGVQQSHETAFDWFAKAGQAGLLDARVIVADMLERGDGHNQDFKYAVMWYQAAADQGDVYAMTELGAHLRLGKGVDWSEAQAMQWFAKAAQKGYVPAQTSLAIGYENGLGQDSGQGRQDYQQAAYWFGLAADQNDGYAQLNLGVMYEQGWGVPQNLQRAKQLYARAAGSPDPQIAKLGREYFSDVPYAPSSSGTPQRSVASSSKSSSDFWSVVIVGALAIGVVSLLSSGGSSSSSGTNYAGSGYDASSNWSTPSTPVSSNPPGWKGDTQPYNPHYTDSARMWKIPMGDLTDPKIAWH